MMLANWGEQMNATDRAITQRVIEAREAKKYQKTEFAQKIGLSKSGYTPYEKFEIPFTVEQPFRIAKILERPIEWFLDLPTELTEDEQQLLSMYRRAKELRNEKSAVEDSETVMVFFETLRFFDTV